MNTGTAAKATRIKFERVRVGGCPVDRVSFDECVEHLCQRIEARQRTHVLFINAAKVVKYATDPSLASVIDRADLLLADGVPVVWASGLNGTRLPGRVNGTDLMEHMIKVAADRGYRVFFFGATENVVTSTVATARRRYPDLKVAGYRNGYFSPSDEPAIFNQINASNADIVFIAFGTPHKELWADRNLSRLNVSVCQGVGGSFDVFAGLTKRAPVWMQRAGLEWFFRFIQEPRRMWKRYLFTNTKFLALIFKEAFAGAAFARHHLQTGDGTAAVPQRGTTTSD